MNPENVKIYFYGAFRKYGDHEILSLPAGGNVENLKKLLAKHMAGKVSGFSDSQLILDSAIACNDTVVGLDHKVLPDEIVSILPPVCGG